MNCETRMSLAVAGRKRQTVQTGRVFQKMEVKENDLLSLFTRHKTRKLQIAQSL